MREWTDFPWVGKWHHIARAALEAASKVAPTTSVLPETNHRIPMPPVKPPKPSTKTPDPSDGKMYQAMAEAQDPAMTQDEAVDAVLSALDLQTPARDPFAYRPVMDDDTMIGVEVQTRRDAAAGDPLARLEVAIRHKPGLPQATREKWLAMVREAKRYAVHPGLRVALRNLDRALATIKEEMDRC